MRRWLPDGRALSTLRGAATEGAQRTRRLRSGCNSQLAQARALSFIRLAV